MTIKPKHLLLLLCSVAFSSPSSLTWATSANVLLPSREGDSAAERPPLSMPSPEYTTPSNVLSVPNIANDYAPKEISKGTYAINAPETSSLTQQIIAGDKQATIITAAEVISWTDNRRRDILKYMPISPERISQACQLELETQAMGRGGAFSARIANQGKSALLYGGIVNMVVVSLKAQCAHSFGLNENLGIIPKRGDNYIFALEQSLCTGSTNSPRTISITMANNQLTCQME